MQPVSNGISQRYIFVPESKLLLTWFVFLFINCVLDYENNKSTFLMEMSSAE